MATQRLLVVGGNGFLGSSICKYAVSKGWQVTSISTSGTPFRTPKGHSPAWVSKVQWQAGSAFDPSTYSHLLSESTAVVHTLGTLFENTAYKTAVRTGGPLALLGTVAESFTGSSQNPLQAGRESTRTTYESLNRDSALVVLDQWINSSSNTSNPRPFVYISAEDIFRPFVPSGYIDSKRQAEQAIQLACSPTSLSSPQTVRDILIRPGLMYHPHLRPLTTPIATLLDISANLQRRLRSSSFPLPTPSSLLRSLSSSFASSQASPSSGITYSSTSSPLESIAHALEIPPLHVDLVARAICTSIETEGIRGVVGVREMRELIGWEWDATHGSQRRNRVAEVHTS